MTELIQVRSSVSLVEFPRGRRMWVDPTDPTIAAYISEDFLVPILDDAWTIPDPTVPGSEAASDLHRSGVFSSRGSNLDHLWTSYTATDVDGGVTYLATPAGWIPMGKGVTAQTLLSDIDPSGSTLGDVLTSTGPGADPEWAAPSGGGGGTGALEWMVVCGGALSGAVGDAKQTYNQAATTTTPTGTTVGLTGSAVQHFQHLGSGFAGIALGQLFQAPVGAAGAPMIGQVTTVSSATHISVTFGSAPATSINGSFAAWGTDDSAAINADAASAATAHATLGFVSKGYACASQVNWAYTGLQIRGLGGHSHCNSSGQYTEGGACLMSFLGAAGALADVTYSAATHNPPHIHKMNFLDPLTTHGYTDLLRIRFGTRGICTENRFMYGKKQLILNSGANNDVSWWQIRDNFFLFPQTAGIDADSGDTSTGGSVNGADAINFTGGEFNLNGGAIGVHYHGAQYFNIGGFKMDIDGHGTIGVLLDDTGQGNQPQQGILQTMRFEKTSSSSDTTTGCIRVNTGTSGLSIMGIHIGGGGVTVGSGGDGLPHGFGIYLSGSGSGAGRCQGVELTNCNIGNCDVNLRFGTNTRNNKARGLVLGGLGVLIQFDNDASCIGNRVTDPTFQQNTDPVGTAQIVWGAASVENWIAGYSWQAGRNARIAMAGGPTSNMGGNLDTAYNTTTGRDMVKVSGTWQSQVGPDRGLVIGQGDTIASTGTDAANGWIPFPTAGVVTEMRVTAKSVTTSMVVTGRISTNGATSFGNMTGASVTFASGDKHKEVTGLTVAVSKGDIPNVSWSAGSGSDLVVEFVWTPS